ncbi:hypothetical protein TIFTF001_043911, partial [Ficus carica]
MTKKKMGAFTCHSPAATAVCIIPDSRSVIVPGRRSFRERNITTTTSTSLGGSTIDNNARLLSSVKYSRLVDHHRHNPSRNEFVSTNTLGDHKKSSSVFSPSNKRELAMSNVSENHQQIRPLQKPSAVLNPVPDHVFQ